MRMQQFISIKVDLISVDFLPSIGSGSRNHNGSSDSHKSIAQMKTIAIYDRYIFPQIIVLRIDVRLH
jgi:hypothetical protein